jgi:DegV family protein with EDD domain
LPKVKIMADSTSDLSEDLIKKYDIEIVPLHINLGGKLFLDGIEISGKEIVSYVQRTGELPGTVACSIDMLRSRFEEWTSKGYEIVCHTISSEMSCTYQNAKIASEGLEGVYVIDTRSLTTGVGILTLHSAALAEQGLGAKEIAQATQSVISKVSASFVIENLDYMKKGGRCSGATALGANLLKIKPMIYVEDGAMKVGHKFRGTFQKVLEEYVDLQLKGRDDINTDFIFISHSPTSPELVEIVRERVRKNLDFKNIIETEAGGTVTSHCGENTIGIIFMLK